MDKNSQLLSAGERITHIEVTLLQSFWKDICRNAVTATKTTMVSLANDSLVPSVGSRGAFFFDDLAVENDDSPAPNANGRVYRVSGGLIFVLITMRRPSRSIRAPVEEHDG